VLRSLAFWAGMALFAGLLATGFVLENESSRPSSFRRRLLAALAIAFLLLVAVLLIDVVGGGQR
jgi:hypothetical protein